MVIWRELLAVKFLICLGPSDVFLFFFQLAQVYCVDVFNMQMIMWATLLCASVGKIRLD